MRPVNIIGLATCVFSLLFAYFFLERYLLLEPCPLCILDRIVVALMGLVFLCGLFTSRTRTRHVLSAVNGVILAFGFLFAGRHVYIQNRPVDLEAECLSEQPQIAGMTELIKEAFDAQADCSLIGWELFGLSIPGMTLLLFCFLAALVCAQVVGTIQDADEDGDD